MALSSLLDEEKYKDALKTVGSIRDEFSDSINSFSKNKNLIFLTGDLGFNALENLAASMGDRFINAGVSEQNMIGVAAALTRKNFECWAYSIAPFLLCKTI